jgi:esterase/lipase superfamily enzyme
MSKYKVGWRSPAMGGREITFVRYGISGRPLLLFPTAGGDAEEPERFHLIDAIGPFLADLRLKVYCVDSIAGQAWLKECKSLEQAAIVQNQFDACIEREVVPLIRSDCQSSDATLMVAGASIGAFNALASICRHPDIFSHAICLSGTYDMERFLKGQHTHDYHLCSPLHFVPYAHGETLAQLRQRFILLAHGKGEFEDPEQSFQVARALGRKGIPNRVDEWGSEWRHDWVTWRDMLPKYLGELLPKKAL